jgi:hypothetical protein
MTDTIEWLETIGKNARLRHAPAEELVQTLEQADASDALKAAVIYQDRTRLAAELGDRLMRSDESSNALPYSEEPDEDEDAPAETPEPDQGKS